MKRFGWIVVATVAVVVAVVVVKLSLSGHGMPKLLGTLSLAQSVAGSDARVLVNKMRGSGSGLLVLDQRGGHIQGG